ncbi:MAG: hypothetical protein JO208_15670 [Alphaproteobacteria bacterium]|nr:hypothetical protein [Alphaproteobacteria bacterium]
MFAHRNGGFKIALEVLRGYLKRPSVQILPPPPIASEEHIRRRPGPFKEALEQGKIAPVALRQRLWRTYCNFLRSISEPLDIKCLEPPADAIDQTGCLATAYYGADPTHANTEYGKLVFRQILEECGVA